MRNIFITILVICTVLMATSYCIGMAVKTTVHVDPWFNCALNGNDLVCTGNVVKVIYNEKQIYVAGK